MADSAEGFAVCPVCSHHCRIAEGKSGRCRGRGTKNGNVVPLNYGRVTSLALDPIEKKPLRKFFPGSGILSVGSYGCNLNCPFCQNWEISMSDGQDFRRGRWGGENGLSPETLAGMAGELRARGNIGVAFTYNEPLISWEYVLDTAKLVRKNNMKSVLVTNGCFSGEIADAVLPWVDALNIDLKSFQENVYRSILLWCDAENSRMAAARQFYFQMFVRQTNCIIVGMRDFISVSEKRCPFLRSQTQLSGKGRQRKRSIILCASTNNPMTIADTLKQRVCVIIRCQTLLLCITGLRRPEVLSIRSQYGWQCLTVFL